MSIVDRGRRRVRAMASQLLATKTIAMRNQQAIVSFTFDDFPRSAVTKGAKILENYGVLGTFYAAGSLCGGTIEGADCFNSKDIQALAAAGHEVGCHTFSHLPVSTLTTHILRQEIVKNAAFVADNEPGYVLCNFAYPFGDVSPLRKSLLQRQFASCRGTKHGLNANRVDLGLLKAVRLYSHLIDELMISKLIDEAVTKSAWLILYTHDVDDPPSSYGCTPSLFEYAVKAATSKTEVLTVRNAIAAVRYGDSRP